MSLLEQLAKRPPRETSGSRTANRFSYQKNWALCLLLELHESENDYVLILDYHDDVLVVDSEVSPSSVEFYQVKTQKGARMSLGKLLRKKKGAKFSILGKLLSNLHAFPDNTQSLNLVSSVPFSIKLASTGKRHDGGKAALSEICSDDMRRILGKLKDEHGLKDDPDIESKLFFIVSDLNLVDCDTHAQGKLSKFLDASFPKRTFRVTAVYRTLINEIQRRNDREEEPKSAEDLLLSKAISKSNFTKMLMELPDGHGGEAIVDAMNEMRSGGIPYEERDAIRSAARRYEFERMDPSNRTLQTFRADLIAQLRDNKARGKSYPSLSTKLNSVVEDLTSGRGADLVGDDAYLKAMVILEGWYV